MGLSRVVSGRAAAHLAIGGLSLCVACGGSAPPNVLLITLDTTRADHLGVYGHRRDTSPNIDALAVEADLYRNARSTSSWTLPSHASIFTGKLPSSHGARYDPEGPLDLGEAIDKVRIRARGVSPGEATLAKRLSGAGYDTAGFAGGPWLLRTFGLAEGFEHWDDEGILDHRGRAADDLAAAVIAWLESWRDDPRGRPFFVFVNFFDPHFPFDPPTRLVRKFLPQRIEMNRLNRSQFDALYDAEIRYADEHVGLLLEALREWGIYDDTLVIVTSDHGEMLGEQGEWGHNGLLLEPLMRVPLIVKRPGSPEPRVVDRPIQLDDLFGLVLEAAGLAPGAGEDPAGPVLAEVWHPPHPGVGEWKALWEGDLKYMHHGDGRHRLYDLERDPLERVNLIDERPEDARRLRERLGEILAGLPKPLPAGEAREIDPQTREALERLGYIDSVE